MWYALMTTILLAGTPAEIEVAEARVGIAFDDRASCVEFVNDYLTYRALDDVSMRADCVQESEGV